ncbi:NADH-quinone oxidoreductase subunit L [Mucilaginibacter sp. BT774]|uniref:NADH-quinone oxidoreductase subunit 5 family protein n=1 Tax=Mucilaginibacter sp. BT774 TaxID=3062276 RepID=UPI002676677F|nr:NADH-quinone oxidoreductase subunit L [Mucilaginibacter sp. BT774]MDO3626013.1 NADH-quinone oxidoreductase subunit L [Mucilaginibacter sp. BT774]
MENFLQAIDTLTIRFALAAVLLPLLAFMVNVCLPGKNNKVAGWISTFAILAGAVFSVFVFSKVWNQHQVHQQQLWFTIGQTKLYAGVLLNNLSVLMLLLVSLIALPVHIYSTAYMGKDENSKRYFTYLSFFCFSMLALVVIDNLILFYIFWELVGFSSYLLIGFWYTRSKAVIANKKAFIMNRIGDIGLLAAIAILFTVYHTFDIDQLFGANALVRSIAFELPGGWQYVAFGGIALAVAAKSAQFPLHTWLPDAMEGPTSVSALIHAATMVAAGVFLLGRVYPVFTELELNILAIIGAFTAFMAATIALTQNDLKRILAYSTISQLGFMVMAMGIGAYSSSLFHLATHAFFKCLLFLVAGIVIHQVQHAKDEYKLDIDPKNVLYMGGLAKKMPFTFVSALIAGLALIGFIFTSGYLSKDGILIQSFEWAEGKYWLFKLIPISAIITSLMTAFYVTRLIVKVFFGEFKLSQINPSIELHVSDGGWQYKLPLVFLSVCCLFPLFSFTPFLYERAWLLNGFQRITGLDRVNIYHTIVPVGVNILSLFVIYWAYAVYVMEKALPFPEGGWIFRLSYHEWYIDKIYNKIIVGPVLALGKFARWFDINIIDGFIHLLQRIGIACSKITDWTDRYIIDGLLHLIAAIVLSIGNFARSFQGGKVQYYLFSMLAIILAIFLFKILI